MGSPRPSRRLLHARRSVVNSSSVTVVSSPSGSSQQDQVAEDLVVEIPVEVQAVASALGPHHGADGLGRPLAKADGDRCSTSTRSPGINSSNNSRPSLGMQW